jgi:DNA-binding NarL/FixJ family response regulator
LGQHPRVTSAPTRLLIVSGQDIVAGGLAALLEPHPAVVEVLPFDGSVEAVPGPVDVVVYDVLRLLDGDTDELRRLVELSKGVIALGRDLRPDLAVRAVALGAVTTISLGALAAEVLAAVRAVHRGETAELTVDREWLAQAEGLSEREAEVLGLITQGLTNQEIAARLYLSVNSVKTYIRTAYRKIGATRRTQAVGWAMDHGFTTAAGV